MSPRRRLTVSPSIGWPCEGIALGGPVAERAGLEVEVERPAALVLRDRAAASRLVLGRIRPGESRAGAEGKDYDQTGTEQQPHEPCSCSVHGDQVLDPPKFAFLDSFDLHDVFDGLERPAIDDTSRKDGADTGKRLALSGRGRAHCDPLS